MRGETPASKRKKADSAFVPKLIEEGWDDEANLFGFIPHQIEADWHDKWGPVLQGFSLNILFTEIAKDGQTGKKSVVEAYYWPDLETFREDAERREICYFTEPMNDYFVRATFEKSTGRSRTEKFEGKKLIRSASGSTFEQTMTHTTMGGLEPDEYPPMQRRRHGQPGRRAG